MPELALVRSEGVNGALRFNNYQRQDFFTIGATTGVPFGSYYQTTSTITAAATLGASSCGVLTICTTDAVVVTLPATGYTATTAGPVGLNFSVMNCASDGGALLQVKTSGNTFYIAGDGGSATTNLVISNTKATQRFGDTISLMATGSGGWMVTKAIGTWALSATS